MSSFTDRVSEFLELPKKTCSGIIALGSYVRNSSDLYIFRSLASKFTKDIYTTVLNEVSKIRRILGTAVCWNFPLEIDLKYPIETGDWDMLFHVFETMDAKCKYLTWKETKAMFDNKSDNVASDPRKFMHKNGYWTRDAPECYAWSYENIPDGGNAILWAIRSNRPNVIFELEKRKYYYDPKIVIGEISKIRDYGTAPMAVLSMFKYCLSENIFFKSGFKMPDFLEKVIRANDTNNLKMLIERGKKIDVPLKSVKAFAEMFTYSKKTKDLLICLVKVLSEKTGAMFLEHVIENENEETFATGEWSLEETIREHLFSVSCDTLVQRLCGAKRLKTLLALIRSNPSFLVPSIVKEYDPAFYTKTSVKNLILRYKERYIGDSYGRDPEADQARMAIFLMGDFVFSILYPEHHKNEHGYVHDVHLEKEVCRALYDVVLNMTR